MPLQNTFILDVDFKKSNYINEPTITQNDEVIFILNVFDDGLDFDLSIVSTFTLASIRPDKQSVMTLGTKTGTSQVTFTLGTTEINVPGRVNAAIQLYDASGRISTLPFTYLVIKDPATNYVPSQDEQTLIELVLGEGPAILAAAEQATVDANTASALANQSAINADAAILDANTATDNANTAATNADAKATLANDAATTANVKATLANNAAINADAATADATNATIAINLVLPNVEGLEFIDSFDPLITYSKNNIVYLNGSSYISIVNNNLGNTPVTTQDAFWGRLALKGLDGSGSVVTVNGISPDEYGNVTLVIPDPDLSGYATTTNLSTLEQTVTTNKQEVMTHLEDLASQATGKGASLIGVEDATGLFTATTVEGALKESIEKANSAFTSASNGKTVVGNAITGVDPNIVLPAEPTFQDLATAIGSISTGPNSAFGTIAYMSNNATEIINLPFIPKLVFFNCNYGINVSTKNNTTGYWQDAQIFLIGVNTEPTSNSFTCVNSRGGSISNIYWYASDKTL